MKKAILLIVVICSTSWAYGTGKNRPVNLMGSWKEAVRYSKESVPVDYDDTTYYDFLVGNEYTVQRMHSYMYRGTYKVEAGQLDLGMRAYNIVESGPNSMLLKDDAGSYRFVRYDKAATLAENDAAADNGERAYKEDLNGASVSARQLAGRWEVYKRTSSEKLPEIDYTKILRVIDVKTDGNKITGNVLSAKDMDGSPSWKITGFDHATIYCSGRYDRQLKVLKCKNGELIIEEGIMTYFFKQFK